MSGAGAAAGQQGFVVRRRASLFVWCGVAVQAALWLLILIAAQRWTLFPPGWHAYKWGWAYSIAGAGVAIVAYLARGKHNRTLDTVGVVLSAVAGFAGAVFLWWGYSLMGP